VRAFRDYNLAFIAIFVDIRWTMGTVFAVSYW